jgi:hypothetical protein
VHTTIHPFWSFVASHVDHHVLPRKGDTMTKRTTKSIGLLVVVGFCMAWAPRCIAADKHARLIGLYDVTVHFQDPAVNWQQVSEAFVKQFLVDTDTNTCIQPVYLPERILGNPEPQTHVGFPGWRRL